MDKQKIASLITLVIITGLGVLFRFYEITKNPVSLNTDEVTFAYNAYSILKTGRDEYGKFMPLTFQSVGDYKNPVPTYFLVPSIALFGLNEFGVRFPFALIGSLAIPLFYFLSLQLTQNRLVALSTSGLLAISPWHIFYSRFGSDQQMAMVIATFGLLMFLKMLHKGVVYSILAALFLVLSMYTYYSERVFIPLLIFVLIIIYFPRLRKNVKNGSIFLLSCCLLVAPLVYSTVFGPDLARGNMVFIAKDIDFTRYIILDHASPGFIIANHKIEESLALVFLVIKRYLNYLQPDFLFFNGLNMTQGGSLGLGVLYVFELPWLILGIIEIIRRKDIKKSLILAWIALAFFPAAFTNNEQNPSRTIIALPMFLIINALGFVKFIQLLNQLKSQFLKVSIYLFYGLIVSLSLMHAYLTFTVHLPLDRGEYSMEGNKEAVLYALASQDYYDEIVFDPIRGREAPTIYGLPHAYVLFYSQYDPAKYQKEEKNKDGAFGFSKYRIRKIYWPDDQQKKGVLFIGSPWSLPEKDLKKEEILKKIYLSNGTLAFLIVTPKPHEKQI